MLLFKFMSTRKLMSLLGAVLLIVLCTLRLLQAYLGTIAIPSDEIFDSPWQKTLSQSLNLSIGTTPVRKWAYAFLIGGCSENKPEYRGFLYNVIVAAQRLKEVGSKADVLLMVQMSIHTKHMTLPDFELRVLDAMGIHVHYIPKVAAPVHEVF